MTRQEEFRARVVALMAEFGVTLEEDDHYGGDGDDEDYMGSTYRFTGDGIALEVSALPHEPRRA